ncbi:MAG: prepilin-type N-terminal cleavage/methylation domain-containing protein [Patescibacteria group bacterium]|nr:prepilin-type N-terminal cleavage/methylation domain-containing protein [Patescibacteria group bacterium]
MRIFKAKKLQKENSGLTLVEILIVIAIISIISSFFIININQKSMQSEIIEETDLLVADLRYVRNLAVSRTTYTLSEEEGAQYPSSGYKIVFDRVNNKARYRIFADFGDQQILIKERTVNNTDVYLKDHVEDKASFYVNFLTENQADSNMAANDSGKYLLAVVNNGPGYPNKGYRSIITLGEKSFNAQGEVEYTWANFGLYYEDFTPPRPPLPPEDPQQLEML